MRNGGNELEDNCKIRQFYSVMRTAVCQDMQLLGIDNGHTLSRNSAQVLFREKYQALLLRTRSSLSNSTHPTIAVGVGAIEANVDQTLIQLSDSAYPTSVNVAGVTSPVAVAQTLPIGNTIETEAGRNEHGHPLASNRAITAIMRDTTLDAVEKQLRAQAVRAGPRYCQPATTSMDKSKPRSSSKFEINRLMDVKLTALSRAHAEWLLTQLPLPVDKHGLNMWPSSNSSQNDAGDTTPACSRTGKFERAQ